MVTCWKSKSFLPVLCQIFYREICRDSTTFGECVVCTDTWEFKLASVFYTKLGRWLRVLTRRTYARKWSAYNGTAVKEINWFREPPPFSLYKLVPTISTRCQQYADQSVLCNTFTLMASHIRTWRARVTVALMNSFHSKAISQMQSSWSCEVVSWEENQVSRMVIAIVIWPIGNTWTTNIPLA